MTPSPPIQPDIAKPSARRRGAVVLCGGKSSRMGQPKHLLPFGQEVALQRTVRTISAVTSHIAVVAAVDQEVPPLPPHCQVTHDEVEFQGPLAGLKYGMQALAGKVDTVYLSGCDVPLLKPQFVSTIFDHLHDAEIAIPFDSEFLHPLAAVYDLSLLATIEEMLQAGERRPRRLIERAISRKIPVDDLRHVDPQLDSLRNMNTPAEYAELLRRIDA